MNSLFTIYDKKLGNILIKIYNQNTSQIRYNQSLLIESENNNFDCFIKCYTSEEIVDMSKEILNALNFISKESNIDMGDVKREFLRRI